MGGMNQNGHTNGQNPPATNRQASWMDHHGSEKVINYVNNPSQVRCSCSPGLKEYIIM